MSNYGSSHSSLTFYFFFCVLLLSKGNVLKINTKFCVLFFLFHNIVACVLVCLCSFQLVISGAVEINPGPLNNCKGYSSVCHWNLNSISAHDYSKLFFLKAFVILHKFDIICFSETYLDSATPTSDDKSQIPGYTLIPSDHLSTAKRDSVCIYYRSSSQLRVINIGYLHEFLSFEMKIGDKICNFVAICRSQSQSQDDF